MEVDKPANRATPPLPDSASTPAPRHPPAQSGARVLDLASSPNLAASSYSMAA